MRVFGGQANGKISLKKGIKGFLGMVLIKQGEHYASAQLHGIMVASLPWAWSRRMCERGWRWAIWGERQRTHG
ncbi:MAG: hypothetical protein CM1200mP14_28120 [Gammaproteobacteria bacterium]|nr:MAG: hypothetical protein CM1200mP14_28120 [Gammaproteobacteria bacterium]